MTDKLHPVRIAEMVVSNDPDDILVVYGLGSCVVICLYDPVVSVGGILHALLPEQVKRKHIGGKLTKFVDQGVPLLISSLVALGAKPTRLIAHVCGGAQMITPPGFNDMLNIGERNIEAAQIALKAVRLKVYAQATGGRRGRTIKFYITNGQITVRTLGQKEQILT